MKRIKKIVFVILSIFLGIVLIFNIYNFISLKVLHKDLATVNGYALLEVVSGSMEPTIHKGDIIIINTKEKKYKANDIITFRGKEGEFVTHRIKSIDNKTMITKGDNNNTEDDPINNDVIVGKYITKIKGAGRVLSSFKNPLTLVMIFIIGLLGCILLSTDSDGKPKLDAEEKEFQEFLKNKNESQIVKNNKKDNTSKAKTNTTNKSDTNKKKTPVTNNTKKDSKPKTKSSNSIKTSEKKNVPKKEIAKENKSSKNIKTVTKTNKTTTTAKAKSKNGTTKKTNNKVKK